MDGKKRACRRWEGGKRGGSCVCKGLIDRVNEGVRERKKSRKNRLSTGFGFGAGERALNQFITREGPVQVRPWTAAMHQSVWVSSNMSKDSGSKVLSERGKAAEILFIS